ncbi:MULTISPECIES: hypothetical protein [unclassified Paenibacillus]|uniref:hypothetical protein n=1 Tax=unclassified Paenibacillus TaxID=185978 RepID=UPI002F40212D
MNETKRHINSLLDADHPLCRNDVIWLLQCIKKRVADEDPALLDLPQLRLIQSFHAYAEAALCLIQRGNNNSLDANQMREWLSEASSVLLNNEA